MFILTVISDTIPIEPNDFKKTSRQALEDNINAKYANRIIYKLGMCICFYDLLEASDGLIGHGDGIIHVNAKFRMVIFRPFKGEVIEGTIDQITPTAIRISLDFFDDIYVRAPTSLFENTRYDETEKAWIWNNDGTDFFFDVNERVRFRVEDEIWSDRQPKSAPRMGADGKIEHESDSDEEADEADGEALLSLGKNRVWRITASMSQGGLGLVSWWM